MQILKLDPRALKDNPDDTRRSKSSPQSGTLLLATVKAVGIIQPPVICPEVDGGNGYIIQAGHRRVKQAIAAGLEGITVFVVEAANDNGAMRSMVENMAREPSTTDFNPLCAFGLCWMQSSVRYCFAFQGRSQCNFDSDRESGQAWPLQRRH